MKTYAHRWIVVAAIISVGAGVALSHVIEPGVRVEKIILTTNTPALRIFPATPGPHPIALLAHGNVGSKEMLFRFGDALAAAGFECYSVDLAGYGESPQPWSLTNIDLNFQEAYRALGTVDVFIGHSLGGGVGGWSVLNAGFRPKLFIGVGAPVKLGEHTPPLLLLGGLFEEIWRPAKLKARTDAQVVISPWCDHILEAYDPVLVRAAVKAACAAVGKPVPAAPTAWRLRFAGLVLGIAGALVLMFRLPELHPRLARIRGFIVPGVLLLALVLTLWPWLAAVVLGATCARMNPWLEQRAVRPRVRARLPKVREICEGLNLTVMNLLTTQPVVPGKNILLIEGIYDLMCPKDDIEDLWHSWGQPDSWRLPHGHVGVCCGFVPGLSGRIIDWLTPRLNGDTVQTLNK